MTREDRSTATDAPRAWRALPLACPDCGADLSEEDSAIVCANGHACGRVERGVPNFTVSRSGVDARLVSFWSSSDHYYAVARELNRDYSGADHASHQALLSALQGLGAGRVLDVGCGTAEFGLALAERVVGLDYVGIDVSSGGIQAAIGLGRPGTFVVGDAERLPFADESFDAVISLYVLEHFSHPRESLLEMVRILRPGGILGILSLSCDRPLGTMPSLRLGLVWRGRKLPRWHPANVAVYAANKIRFGLRQALKQIRYAIDPAYTSFELVNRPLVLDEPYAIDTDAVHVVSGSSVLRLLASRELAIVDTTMPARPLLGLRVPLDFRVIARK